MPIKTLIRRLSKAENTAITRDATTDGVVDKNLVATVKEKVLSIKNAVPNQRWMVANQRQPWRQNTVLQG